MQKEIIVLGDIEMGGGTNTDDFISDKALSRLILSLKKRKHPVDLILNGDTFDFLKCPHFINGKKGYPRHITVKVSLDKLHLMYKAHRKIFDALMKFIQQKKNHLHFIIGNHDHDLFFPEVQKQLRVYLKSKGNIFFQLFYKKHSVYVEHGHQYDFLNKINPRFPFLYYRQNKILNIPWVAFGIISKFLVIKDIHPFLERIVPRPVLFSHHRAVAKKISWETLEYYLKSFFYYPLRYFHDPTYSAPRGLFREGYRRFKDVHWDVDEIVGIFKRKRKRLLKSNRIHVLGHVHQRYVEEKDGWVILHPDTWRDEYILDSETKKLYPKSKHYLSIELEDDDSLKWNLIEAKIKRTTLDFYEMLKDEMGYIKKAAQEEGYKFTTSLQ